MLMILSLNQHFKCDLNALFMNYVESCIPVTIPCLGFYFCFSILTQISILKSQVFYYEHLLIYWCSILFSIAEDSRWFSKEIWGSAFYLHNPHCSWWHRLASKIEKGRQLNLFCWWRARFCSTPLALDNF